jgi:hypothetical protein
MSLRLIPLVDNEFNDKSSREVTPTLHLGMIGYAGASVYQAVHSSGVDKLVPISTNG